MNKTRKICLLKMLSKCDIRMALDIVTFALFIYYPNHYVVALYVKGFENCFEFYKNSKSLLPDTLLLNLLTTGAVMETKHKNQTGITPLVEITKHNIKL